MSCFISVEGLADLERQGKWEDARQLLHKEWTHDKLNSGKLIRLLSECWYVLSLWDCSIYTKNLSYKKFKETIVECAEFGRRNFNNDDRFLCVAGYMASILPNLFYNDDMDDLYSEWEQKGKDMLLRAARISPDNLICKVLYLGTKGVSEEYSEAKTQLATRLNDFFPGSTAIEEYFKDIFRDEF